MGSIQAIQQKITDGQFADALADADALLANDPLHGDALYMAAVCHRYLSQYEQAQARLDTLKSLGQSLGKSLGKSLGDGHSRTLRRVDSLHDAGRVWQEQGHLLLAQKLHDSHNDSHQNSRNDSRNNSHQNRALAAYRNACLLNPALLASWKARHGLLQAGGRQAEAEQVKAQWQRLASLPSALIAVMDLLAQGKLRKAEALCRKFLKANPTHTEAMRLLAEIAMQFGEFEDAEFLLESAVAFEPDNIHLSIDYIGALRRRQKFVRALDVARNLHESQPHNPSLQSIYAIEKLQLGDYAAALALFDQVLDALPNDPATLTSKGHALKTCGKQPEAVACYKAAIAADPLHGDAWYSLSNLKTWRFSEAEVAQMLALEPREELTPASRVHLAFALGKAFEDAGDFARSFEFYARGNGLKCQQGNYDADKMAEELLAQQQYFTSGVLARREATGVADPDPIFILGLPRAGSTLLEQILSSHSQVDGTLELPNILSIAQKLKRQGRAGQEADAGSPAGVDASKPYPDLLGDMSNDELRQLGQQYLDETHIHRQGAPFFIDKMPNNFRHIGLIKLILPNAKIIDARREALACCFSGFKQLFAEGQEFSYSLVSMGRYYAGYVALMEHWHRVLPGEVLTVQHEAVVADLEGQVRRMLDFCGLEFEAACLNYHETERAVRTPSSEQVRQPIFTDALDQWRNFEPWLDPLKDALSTPVAL